MLSKRFSSHQLLLHNRPHCSLHTLLPPASYHPPAHPFARYVYGYFAYLCHHPPSIIHQIPCYLYSLLNSALLFCLLFSSRFSDSSTGYPHIPSPLVISTANIKARLHSSPPLRAVAFIHLSSYAAFRINPKEQGSPACGQRHPSSFPPSIQKLERCLTPGNQRKSPYGNWPKL